jgi:serine protease
MSHEHLSSGSLRTGRSSLAVAAILVLFGLLVILAFRPGASAQTSPNDPRFPSQWAPGKIRAPDAWDLTKGSASIKVAVVSGGISSTLADLQGQLGPGYNAQVPGGSTDDDVGSYGSGTKAAGIIGARTNNALDMAGISWNITMLPVKVCSAYCDGDQRIIAADVAEGINWAANNGAQIIHVSTGLDVTVPELDAAVANAVSRGVLVVAAAGNVASHVRYPAALPGVIAVGAVDSNDVLATFSGRGPELDITAPGVSVLTLVSGGCCMNHSGTELAAAHVSGALALLLAAGVPASQAPGYLFQGARDLGPAGWDSDYGWGRLDVCGALTAAGIACPSMAATPTRTPTPVPLTATPTRTPTSMPPTATRTRTPTSVPPTATPTRTPTSMPPTATRTRTPTSVPPTATRTRTPTPTPQTEVISGTLHKPSPTSADKALDLKSGQSLQAKLTWTGSAVLELYLYNPAGQLVAQGTGADKGRALSYIPTTAGTYTLRVALTSGGWADYSLTITH